MSCDNSEPVELCELAGVDADYEAVFSALSTPRSRCLFAHLDARDAEVALEDVARSVAAWELDCEPSELSEDAEQSVLVSLYHAKAPMLAEAGLVDFDPDERTVEITDAGAQIDVEPFLPGVEQTV